METIFPLIVSDVKKVLNVGGLRLVGKASLWWLPAAVAQSLLTFIS